MASPPVGPAWYRVLLTVLCVIGVVWFAVGRAWVPALVCALGAALGVIDVVRLRRAARVRAGQR
ncbi:hypothetical protein [Micromonospora sp. IBHARD004]|uniref:hypothetical protein n=1 Tax=Micromonospora sp. IBHARD004 TaxID=3457764 RepID=UPI0040588E36